MNASIVDQPLLTNVEPLLGLATLTTRAFRGEDLMPLGNRLIAYAQEHPHAANALLDLSIVLHLKEIHDLALSVQDQALQQQ